MRLSIVMLVASALALASAARMPMDIFASSDSAPGGLHNSAQGLLGMMRHHKHDSDEEHAIATVRFFVPPSEADGFEDEWLDLEKDVDKEEEDNVVFDLKKTKLDNLIYYSYGEWESHEAIREHFTSDHFEDFADWVDEHGIRWELQILKCESEEIDDEQRHRSVKVNAVDKKKQHSLAHVLFTFIVPPGEGEKFTDAWIDAAEDTIKEEGNRVYSLKKVATDNTRYYAYGTWDSMEDFFEHYQSKHLQELVEYTEDKDIVWFIQPLIKIGNQPE